MTDANADATLPDGTDLGLATHERLDARLDALERSRALATTNGDGAMARLSADRPTARRPTTSTPAEPSSPTGATRENPV